MNTSAAARTMERWYSCVDESSGVLMRFKASGDNQGAKDRVMRSLKYVEANSALMEFQTNEKRQVPFMGLKERQRAYVDRGSQSRKSDLHRIIENYDLTIEGFEKAHKICKKEIGHEFLCQIPELGQLSVFQINELKNRAKETCELYVKKYHEDPEWQVCKAVNAFVDQLLQKKNEEVERAVVNIAQEERYMTDLTREPRGRQVADNRLHHEVNGLERSNHSSVKTSPVLSTVGPGFAHASQNDEPQSESRIRLEKISDIVCDFLPHEAPCVRSNHRPPSGSSFGDESRLQNTSDYIPQNEDEHSPIPGELPMPDEDESDHPDDAMQTTQAHVDMLKNIVLPNFIHSQMVNEDSLLYELCCNFLVKKTETKRTYEENEAGKSIEELFYGYIKRMFKTADRKIQMAGSRDVSAKQFVDAFRSAVNIIKAPSQKQFTIRVIDGNEWTNTWYFNSETSKLEIQ